MSKGLTLRHKNSTGLVKTKISEYVFAIQSLSIIGGTAIGSVVGGFIAPSGAVGIPLIVFGFLSLATWLVITTSTDNVTLGVPRLLSYRKIMSAIKKSGIKYTHQDRKAIWKSIDGDGEFHPYDYKRNTNGIPHFSFDKSGSILTISEDITSSFNDIFIKAVTLKEPEFFDRHGDCRPKHELSEISEHDSTGKSVREHVNAINSNKLHMRFENLEGINKLILATSDGERIKNLGSIRDILTKDLSKKLSYDSSKS